MATRTVDLGSVIGPPGPVGGQGPQGTPTTVNGKTGSSITLTAQDVGAALPSVSMELTLTAAGWSGSGPFTQTVGAGELQPWQNGDVGLTQSATAEQRAAAREAMISVTGQVAGTLTMTADGEKPTVDIPCVVVMLG